ncbi:MAG: DUF4097 family beta strand repeat-containing protein [Clostridiaceae bacterium]|jgi:DUF4097 and DUF4098 domain-containing protein YvlB|nr:DUF4097 family beta strand repeat-containing protein [Clostridiaceae bacterium]
MEEKMLILKMLQEGKITADDAVKLLEALENGSTGASPSGSRINEIKDEFTARLNEIKIDEKLNKFGEKASKLASTFGEKAGKLAEQLGENINSENTEKFTEEFTKRMESLGQDIAESAVKLADNFANQVGSLFETVYEKYRYNSSYKYPVADAQSIYLETSNFSVKVGHSDTKEMTVNLFVNSNIPQLAIDEYFKTIADTDGYRLSSEFPGRTWGRIEIQLPKGMNLIKLSTDNAKCEINDMDAKLISCTTANGRITLTNCSADEIELFTDNEKIVLNEVSARTANIRTSNSKISIEGSHLDSLDAKTSNAAIMVNASRKGDSLSSGYILSTSNGKIDIGLAKEEGFEHMVDAHTTMSSIEVKLANLTYATDKKSIGMQGAVQIKSDNFDTASSKISIKANTSNAPITIENI